MEAPPTSATKNDDRSAPPFHIKAAPGAGGDPVAVTPQSAGWTYSGLRVVVLSPGESKIRGAGDATRQLNNFCAPGVFTTDKLTAVAVLTPPGNWSSYPPHKHDEDRPGEAILEEIYYFRLQGDASFGVSLVNTDGSAVESTPILGGVL